jgi:hypothetical protein
MKKRALTTLLAGALTLVTLGTTACDSDNGGESGTPAAQTTSPAQQGGNGASGDASALGFGEEMLPPPEWFYPLLQGKQPQHINAQSYTTADVDISVLETLDDSYKITNISDKPVWHFVWSELFGELEGFRRTEVIEPGDHTFILIKPFGRGYWMFVSEPEGFEMLKAFDLGNGTTIINSDSSKVVSSAFKLGEDSFRPLVIGGLADINHPSIGGVLTSRYDLERDLLILHENTPPSDSLRHHYVVANFEEPHVLWVCFDPETPMAIIRNASAAWYRVDSSGEATSMMTSLSVKRAEAEEDTWAFLMRTMPDNGDTMELRVYCLETDELLETHTEDFVSGYTPFDWGIDSMANNVFN